MPPKPLPNLPMTSAPRASIVSAAVKAAAAASKVPGGVTSATVITKQPPKKKKTVTKARRPGGHNPLVVIGKDDTLHPPSSTKLGVMKKASAASSGAGSSAAIDSVQFSSQFIKKKSSSATSTSGAAGSGGGNGSSNKPNVSAPGNSAAALNQLKLEKAKIAKRELAEMDGIERAFREDANVWNGPANVVFPRRFHHADQNQSEGVQKKDTGDASGDHDEKSHKSAISNPYMNFYGSQSQGWMYGEGYAGIGGRSWMEVTNNDKKGESSATATPPEQLADDATNSNNNNNSTNHNPSFLMDDVNIIENALKSNGLARNDVTPKAYACFLEQARRYALELLADAQDYAMHAERSTVPALLPADLLLAAEMREDGGGSGGVASTLPAPDAIADLATDVNRRPLPPIPANCYNGVALPPSEEQLTARTYDVVNGARVAQRMMRGGDLPLTSIDSGSGGGLGKKKAGVGGAGGGNSSSGVGSTKKKKMGSYGAGKGRQIAVHMKSNKTSGAASDKVKAGAANAASVTKTAGGATLAGSGSKSSTTKSGPKPPKRKLIEL